MNCANSFAITVGLIAGFSCTSAHSQESCDVVLQTQAFNRADSSISSRIALAKKEELCSSNFSSDEEFRSSAKSSGFSLGIITVSVGASGTRSSGSGSSEMTKEDFCSIDNADIEKVYDWSQSIQNTDAAVLAWRECVEKTNDNALWLEYMPNADGSGFAGVIYRTVGKGGARANLSITDMVIQPETRSSDVTCTIEGQTVTQQSLREVGPVTFDTTKEGIQCTKPSNAGVFIIFGTDQASLDPVFFPSSNGLRNLDIAETNESVEALRQQLERLQSRLSAVDRVATDAGTVAGANKAELEKPAAWPPGAYCVWKFGACPAGFSPVGGKVDAINTYLTNATPREQSFIAEAKIGDSIIGFHDAAKHRLLQNGHRAPGYNGMIEIKACCKGQ